jgi:hypothetical protein
VLRSALAHFGDESRIASQGPSGSPHVNHNEAGLRQEQRASRCTICRSPARQRIDQALASGVSVRDVARQEALSKSVVGRHRDHGLGHAVSHFQRPISGTGDTGHHQGQTTRSVQLDLLSLAAEREDPA